MILNKNLLLSAGQAITATAISTNVIQWETEGTIPYDAAAMSRNLGAGTYIPLLIQVTTTFATLTSLTVTLETAADAALSSGAVVLGTTGAVAAASLVAGYRFPQLRIFPEGTLKDYVGLRYTVGGSNATAGAIWAAIATEVNSP